MTEADLIRSLVRQLRSRWAVRASGLEVRSHGRCRTDACVEIRDVNSDQHLLVGIEGKLSDWARVIGQAALNRYAVDVSFVAVPSSRASDALLREAARHGVGVLAVDSRSVDVLVPGRHDTPDPILRARVVSQLIRVRPRGAHSPAELLLPTRRQSLAVGGAA